MVWIRDACVSHLPLVTLHWSMWSSQKQRNTVCVAHLLCAGILAQKGIFEFTPELCGRAPLTLCIVGGSLAIDISTKVSISARDVCVCVTTHRRMVFRAACQDHTSLT
ncbi:hypothetical protein TRVL_07268 [Trypanosoma vivax]|nr:hypothetical protein TRVL_07268 [Trypanosoma vivax]